MAIAEITNKTRTDLAQMAQDNSSSEAIGGFVFDLVKPSLSNFVGGLLDKYSANDSGTAITAKKLCVWLMSKMHSLIDFKQMFRTALQVCFQEELMSSLKLKHQINVCITRHEEFHSRIHQSRTR